MKLLGYAGVSSFCRENLSNGGVYIFTRDTLNIEKVDVWRYCLEGRCELVAVKRNRAFFIVVVYKQIPYSAFLGEHRLFYGHLS